MTGLSRWSGGWAWVVAVVLSLSAPSKAAEWTYEGGSRGPILSSDYLIHGAEAPGLLQLSYASQSTSWLVRLRQDTEVANPALAIPGVTKSVARLDGGYYAASIVDFRFGVMYVARLDPAGFPVWMSPVAGGSEYTFPTVTKLSGGDILLSINYDQSYYAGRGPRLILMSSLGTVRWQRDLAGGLLVDGVDAYADCLLVKLHSNDSVSVSCLDAITGSPRWQRSLPNYFWIGGDNARRVGSDIEIKLRDFGDFFTEIRQLRVTDGQDTGARTLIGVTPGFAVGANRMLSRSYIDQTLTRVSWIDLDSGSTIWSRDFNGYLDAVVPVDGLSALITDSLHAPNTDDLKLATVISLADGQTRWSKTWNEVSPLQDRAPEIFSNGGSIYVLRFPYNAATRLAHSELTLLDADGNEAGTAVLDAPSNNTFLTGSAHGGPLYLARAHVAWGPTPRSVLTKIDPASGAALFQPTVATGQLAPASVSDLEVTDTKVAVITAFGELPPVSLPLPSAEPRPDKRSSALMTIDASTGEHLWFREFPWQVVNPTNYVFREYAELAADTNGNLYVGQRNYERQPSFGRQTLDLLALDFGSGAFRWQSTWNSNLTISTIAGSPSGVLQPPSNLYSGSNGMLLWRANLGDIYSDRVVARNGDVFLSYLAPQVNPDHVEIRTLDATTGLARWVASLATRAPGLSNAARVTEAENGDLLVRLIRVVDSSTRQVSLARIDRDSGTVKWQSTFPSVAQRKNAIVDLAESTDGSLRVLVLDYSEVPFLSEFASVSWVLYRVDGETGIIGDGHVVDASSFYDLVDRVDSVRLDRWLDSGEAIVVAGHALFGGARQPRVLRRQVDSPLVGDLSLSLTLTDSATGDATKRDFRLEAHYVGNGVLEDAVLETAFPSTAIEGVECVVDLGTCGELTRLGDIRQHLRLEPGAQVIVTGTVGASDPLIVYGPTEYGAYIQGPISLAESDLVNNRAPSRVALDTPTLINGFE